MSGWLIVNHDNDDALVRGPYEEASTAGAVRRELERAGDERNLWIVPATETAEQSNQVPDVGLAVLPEETP